MAQGFTFALLGVLCIIWWVPVWGLHAAHQLWSVCMTPFCHCHFIAKAKLRRLQLLDIN